jgi:hypothetical protein
MLKIFDRCLGVSFFLGRHVLPFLFMLSVILKFPWKIP